MKFQGILATAFMALSGTSALLAGGAWIKPPGSFYAKVGTTFLQTNTFHASDGTLVKTADFSTQTLQFYGECGIIRNLSVVVDVPVFKRSKFVTAEAASGFGDVGMEIKYGFAGGEFPLALGVGFELPTGDERLFARNLSNANVISFQPTGDGEFNTWVRGYASHSFHPVPAFLTLDAGYNFRTKGVTNQYQVGIQGGYRFFDEVWLSANLRRLATAGTANKDLIFNAIGVGEGVEYTSYGFGLSYEALPHVSVSTDIASAIGTVKNIYGGLNIGFGVAVDF